MKHSLLVEMKSGLSLASAEPKTNYGLANHEIQSNNAILLLRNFCTLRLSFRGVQHFIFITSQGLCSNPKIVGCLVTVVQKLYSLFKTIDYLTGKFASLLVPPILKSMGANATPTNEVPATYHSIINGGDLLYNFFSILTFI